MGEQNGRGIYPNPSFNDRFNIPFSTNPSASSVSNTVLFHPMPFQNKFYPPQPMNIPMGVQYSGSDGNSELCNTMLHTNYYQDVPVYENQSNAGNRPMPMTEPNFSNVHQSMSTYSNQYNYSLQKQQPPSLNSNVPIEKPKSKELQLSAKPFVPKSMSEESCLNDKSSNRIHTPDPNINPGDSNPKVTKSKYNNNNNQYGTRPKEFNKGKGFVNRKSWSASQPNPNWQNKENKSYNNPGYRNYDYPAPIPPHEAPSYTLNYYNSENQRSRPPYQNRGPNNFHEPNGYSNMKNRGNSIQKRPNFNPKKIEWRRSNEQNYDYSDYNYYENGRNGWPQNNSYNKKGPKRFGAFPNGNIKENNESMKQREVQDHRQNRPFANDRNQYSKNNKNNYAHPRNYNGSDAPAAFPRKNNVSNEYNREKPSNNAAKAKEENDSCEITDSHQSIELDDRTQRENMIENLTKGIYECMVCCERIRQQHAIWSCNKCYNCFHLGCVKKWAGTSHGEPGWRCPTCQNLNSKIPNGYFCFCKKLREPEWNRREIPHSCGEVCAKKRENVWCLHKCMFLCHPGPCPDCTAFLKRHCQCGQNSKEMRCSQTEPYVCGMKCSRSLNCGVHTCEKLCHTEDCESCSVILEEKCFCEKEKRNVNCTSETSSGTSFSCGAVCDRKLECGEHSCGEICHEGPCKPCSRAIATVNTCPCGKMSLDQYFKYTENAKRTSCLDPIPLCEDTCEKPLKCGTPGSFHSCQAGCHEGPCPPCKDQTAVKCRCGFMDKKILCSELLAKADEVTCEKQCKKLRQCGRHKCGMKCCIDIDHLCTRVCGRTLKCRLHKCEEPCHRGNCPRCWETSFEELSCHCGASVLYPPVPCGTEPPSCELPCRRTQPCSHPVLHNCHADPKCPPCTTLISKPCFGGHMTMKSTPCYVSAMSCGEQCAKRLKCGVHLCQKVCHDGSCTQGSSCTQKCAEVRPSCEHPCNTPCHSGPCPETPCKELVTVTCLCGNRKVELNCSDNEREYKSMATSRLASELHSLNSGGSVDISQIFTGTAKPEKLKRLECNDECGLLARNRQLALALQITNPDAREALGEGGSAFFSDSLKEEAKKDIQFAQMVHVTLNELVIRAKQSKHKNRSHSFNPMNRDKRRFIHEYSKYFGCQSQSYDEEPKKNVVVTACKSMSRLPPISVVALIKKEQGQRKAPGPVLSRKNLAGEDNVTQMKRLEKNSSFEKKDDPSTPKEIVSKDQQPQVIDYFDLS